MAARSIAALSLSFGLVNIPVKLYSATEASASIGFNLLAPNGSRVKQQYVAADTGKVVERKDMIRGYEFEKDRYITFRPEELKALEEGASHLIEIVAFVPERSVDPIYYDKAYYLAPDKRGGKPYSLLREAMLKTGRCALARWSWKSKQYTVQVRANDDGLVLQQLLYAEEVRSMGELGVELVDVSPSELALATQLIGQISQERYDPGQFKDEEHARVLAAIDSKIAGNQIVEAAPVEASAGGQVIDLMDALKASLGKRPAADAPKAASKPGKATRAATAEIIPATVLRERKPARTVAPEVATTPARPKARAKR